MMNFNLEDKRWDIIPLGFDASSPDRVVVQLMLIPVNFQFFLVHGVLIGRETKLADLL